MANSFLDDPFKAEMAVDDVIYHLWEKRESLVISVSLRNYLMQAVRNRCLDQLRMEQHKKEVRFSNLPLENLDSRLFFLGNEEEPLGTLLQKELESEIEKAIKQIPADAYNVFRKSRFENKRNEEIAQELGISVNTVKYHIKKALAVLRKELAQYLTIIILVACLLSAKC